LEEPPPVRVADGHYASCWNVHEASGTEPALVADSSCRCRVMTAQPVLEARHLKKHFPISRGLALQGVKTIVAEPLVVNTR